MIHYDGSRDFRTLVLSATAFQGAVSTVWLLERDCSAALLASRPAGVSMRSESLCFELSDARRSEVHKVRNRARNPLVVNEASNIITIPKNYEIPIFTSKVRRLAMKCPENMLSSPLRLLLRSTSFCSCIFFSYSNPPDAIRPAANSRPRNTVRPAGARSASRRDTGLAKEPLALRIAPRRAGGSAAALLFKTCYAIVSILQAPWRGGF